MTPDPAQLDVAVLRMVIAGQGIGSPMITSAKLLALLDEVEDLRAKVAAVEAVLNEWEPTHGQWISSGAVRDALEQTP